MAEDEFLTSINPLFTAYELEIQVSAVTELFQAEGPLSETSLDDIQAQIQAISGSVSRLADYVEELGNANRNVQNKFGELVNAIEAKLGVKEKDDSEKEDHHTDVTSEKRGIVDDGTAAPRDDNHGGKVADDADALSDDERERLQEHIPAIGEGDDETRAVRRFAERRARMYQLRRELSRLVRNTCKVAGGVQQTRDGVKIIGDSLKEGKKKPTKVILDKPKPEKKRKVLENDKKQNEKQSNTANKKSASGKKPQEERNKDRKKTRSADTRRDKNTERSPARPESETHPRPAEKSPEEIEQERLRLQFELEQALRQQKEQEQREETERRRAEAEDRQRREEDQKQEQRRETDTASWNTLRYDVEGPQVFGAGLGCLVRVEADMDKDAMECSLSHARADAGPLEERVSDVISLKSRDNNPIHFKYPAVVCVPYKVVTLREPVVYVREGKGHWSPVPTESALIDGVRVATFRRRRLKALRCVVVLSRPGVGLTVDPEGGTLQSPEDPGVRVRVPAATVTGPGTTDLQLQVISKKTVSEGLSRLDAKDLIDDVSALSTVTLSKSGLRAAILEATMPSSNKMGSSRKNVYAMMSSDGLSWSCMDPDYQSDPDKFSVSLDHERQSVVYLRTRGYVSKQDLVDMTHELITGLKEFPASLIVSQKEAEPHAIYIRCCRKSEVDDIKSRLSEEGYLVDSYTSTDLYLRDGTRLSMSFSAEGNVDFAEDSATSSALTTTFLSQAEEGPGQLGHLYERRVQVKNVFCQKQHSVYRGKLLVCDTSPEEDGGGGDAGPSSYVPVVLCEIPVTLPKAQDPKTARSVGQPTHYFHGAEPLTEAYVRQLAEDLADDWVEIGHELGLQTAALQQVKQRHPTPADRAFHMLRVWYMKSRKDGSKVAMLVEALHAVGRVDLAEELDRKNQEIIEETKMRVKEQLFSKIAKRISADPRALDNWKGILRGLTLSDEVLAQIEGGATNRISCLQSGLAEWLRTTPDKASPALLMHTLRKMGYHTAAEMLKSWFRAQRSHTDKAEQLIRALSEVGRQDLAEELHTLNEPYVQAREERRRVDNFREIAKEIGRDGKAKNAWREFLQRLGVDSEDIKKNASTKYEGKYIEDGIVRWAKVNGEAAKLQHITNVLKQLNCTVIHQKLIQRKWNK